MTIGLTPTSLKFSTWLTACGCLALLIGQQLNWGQMQPSASFRLDSGASKPAFPPVSEPFRLAPPDHYIDAIERPLFVVTRRPPPPGEGGGATGQMKKGLYRLAGVVIDGNKKIAFLTEIASGKTRAATERETIDGIRVEQIQAQRVLLVQGGDSEDLILKVQVPQKGKPEAVPAAPAPNTTSQKPSTTPLTSPPPVSGVIQPAESPPSPSGEPPKARGEKQLSKERLEYMRSLMGSKAPAQTN